MKFFLLFTSAFLLVSISYSQTFNYTFSQSTGSYAALQDATPVSNELLMYEKYTISIGFPFAFMEQTFGSLCISPAGFLSFDGKNNFSFSVFNGLQLIYDTVQPSTIKYFISGSTGNRICKIEFKDLGLDVHNNSERVSFQIWLYEQDNSIAVLFGSSTINLSENYQKPVIGLINMQQDSTPWAFLLSGDPVTASLLTESLQTATLNSIPVNGTVYVFSVVQ